jgi:hypothetical protein
VSFALTGAALPGLDALAGGAEPADLDVQLTVTQARDIMARSLVDGLERWRQSGGRIEVTTMRLSKGPRGAEGRGDFSLDDAHRPQGRAELATAGLEGLLGTLLGARNSATNALLGALTGRPSGPQTPAATGGGDGKPRLKPLPPLRIEGGRIYLGPIALPGLRVAPLY